jgi:hypothetical protein
MSGSSLMKPIPLEVADGAFDTAMERLELEQTTPFEEQLQALLKRPVEDLATKLVGVPTYPCVDGDVVPAFTAFRTLFDPDSALKQFPGMKWCKRVLFGDCQFDVSLHFTS